MSKKHAIIPIFISHRGCPNDCVFCNQKKITARQGDVTKADMINTIETYMSTLKDKDLECIELSFYGGSFTGIPIEEQNSFLETAFEYKKEHVIDKIHMSTRPDYINRDILDNLKKYSVDVIELGVQSFDDDVLRASRRGHTSKDVYDACSLIQEYGFELGIQLMIGLPGDSAKTCIYSAMQAAKIKPELARLYPTIIIEDTELLSMYKKGEYEPLSLEDAISITSSMYRILDTAGINIMRVGLKATSIINDGGAIAGNTYHPAFRQLVESAIAREDIEKQILPSDKEITVITNPQDISNAAGHNGINRKYFNEKNIHLSFEADESLRKNTYIIKR